MRLVILAVGIRSYKSQPTLRRSRKFHGKSIDLYQDISLSRQSYFPYSIGHVGGVPQVKIYQGR